MEFQRVIEEISPTDLKQRLDQALPPILVDVREPHELVICKLDNALHIPLGQLPQRISELTPYKDGTIVVYCRSGKRSERAAMFMKEEGFPSVLNLKGGILSWADQVDPSLTKY